MSNQVMVYLDYANSQELLVPETTLAVHVQLLMAHSGFL